MSDLTRDYPSNSESERTPADGKALAPVAKGRLKKESGAKKFARSMVAEDAKTVGGYILWDIVVPALKEMVSNAVSSGVERALFGENYRGSNTHRGYTSYSRRSSSPSRISYSSRRDPAPREAQEAADYRDVVLDTRPEAYEVIDRLRDVANRYDIATVGDLYGLVGISSKYTDEDWGWTEAELQNCGARKIRDGFVLEIPEPSYLKAGR